MLFRSVSQSRYGCPMQSGSHNHSHLLKIFFGGILGRVTHIVQGILTSFYKYNFQFFEINISSLRCKVEVLFSSPSFCDVRIVFEIVNSWLIRYNISHSEISSCKLKPFSLINEIMVLLYSLSTNEKVNFFICISVTLQICWTFGKLCFAIFAGYWSISAE